MLVDKRTQGVSVVFCLPHTCFDSMPLHPVSLVGASCSPPIRTSEVLVQCAGGKLYGIQSSFKLVRSMNQSVEFF